MEELHKAAKNLLSHREKYFEAHPEIIEAVEDIEDKEYNEAWDALQAAVDAIEPDHASN